MNKQICIIIFLLTCRICDAQNLVPNPSFEDTVQCPYLAYNLTDAAYWQNFRESPDYFNACANSTQPVLGVPVNARGNQIAMNGDAYIGISCFHFTVNNIREYAGVQLTQLLVPLQKYFVSFYVSLADTNGMNCPSSKIGAKFSTVAYSLSSPAPITNSAHIFTDSIIADKLNWTLICGSFIADSAYSYLMIGNFFDDANTDTANCAWYSYFYVDMICVSTDSLTCNSPVGINETKRNDEMILFPNPFSEKINITAKRNEQLEVSLYDVTSRKIFNQSFTSSITINTEQLAKGIYLYEVRNKNGEIKQGKVVKE